MKKLLSLLILMQVNLVAQTNVYHPFPTDSATWSVYFYNFGPGPGFNCQNTHHFGFLGDTLIGSTTYHKIGRTNYFAVVLTDSVFNPSNAVYEVAIREDSLKRIWAIPIYDSVERILYDFSLTVGDTFYFDYFLPFQILGVVSSVDSVLIGLDYRKTITLTDQSQAQHVWIEGIGSEDGLLQIQMVTSFAERLTCFSQNGQLLYSILPYCHCDAILTTEEITAQNEFGVYPNPTSTGFYIQNSLEDQPYDEVIIYNSIGEPVVYLEQIGGSDFVSMEHLPMGYYLLEVRSAKGIYFSKVFKSN